MYQALYRKYRPLVFKDVLGQEFVTRAIKSQVASSKISHAYIFTGTRGTGKTSCAKILARAVNCERPVNGDPCNECDTCKGILNGSILDVIEIDAASNNKVDDIRELRDEVIFTPALAKYKVYIIDEVHMLTTQAFNALLKTLEEPPEHVVFVLATTEIYKVPQTILSRCQRFDFKRITLDELFAGITGVAQKEGINIDNNAARLIARLADGAMRDALSILDRCAGIDKNVNLELVENIMGVCTTDDMLKALECVVRQDIDGILEFYSRSIERSKDTASIFTELSRYIRDLMVIRLTKKPEKFTAYEADELERLKRLADKFTPEKLLRSIKIIEQGLNEIAQYQDKQILAELTLIKLCDDKVGASIEDLSNRIAKLELNSFVPDIQLSAPKQKIVINDQKEKVTQTISKDKKPFEYWPKTKEFLKDMGRKDLLGFLEDVNVISDNNHLIIYCQSPVAQSFLDNQSALGDIRTAVKRACALDLNVKVILRSKSQHKDDALNDIIKDAKDILVEE